jgi:multisubunit Na+/H+ antiporter MnhG subunit
VIRKKKHIMKTDIEKSKSIAGIVGPTLIVMVSSELKLWNPTLYDEQIVPLIYLSGVLLFIAGLAIIRKHNVWIWGWQTVVTLVGWMGLLLGTLRCFFPQMNKAQFKNDTPALLVECVLILLGIFLTYKAYFSKKN